VKKVDKGFQLVYWKLSYRRKFIRSLWTIPMVIIGIGIIVFQGKGIFISRIMPLILVILFPCELLYNYKKWKNDKEWKNEVSIDNLLCSYQCLLFELFMKKPESKQ